MALFGLGNLNMDTVRVALLIIALALSGCGKPSSTSSSFSEAQSRPLRPPGDKAAWAPRMDKDMSVLVDNVVNGFGGMPPFGLCMDCSAEQFEALIEFMAAGNELQ
jgi:hypothetical protein